MRSRWRRVVLILGVMFGLGSTGHAQLPVGVEPDTVEEDWQIVVASTDGPGVGPQFTTCMSPVSDNSTSFAAFDLNYREFPNFQPGGMQVQVWSASNSVLATASQGSAQFSTSNETVTWSQRMSISSGTVNYQVFGGQSSTWGRFGQGSLLSVSFSTTLTDLSGYTPAASVANSGASWESNLVTSMTLLRVRYYAGGQLIGTDTTPRSISLN